MESVEPLIQASALRPRAADRDVLILDARHDLLRPEAGREAWSEGHIPGSVHLSIDDELSGPRTGINGRHPLPDRDALARRLAELGVSRRTLVVACDAHGGMFAARAWWLLLWLGHEKVTVLDGGIPAWIEVGGAITTEVAPPRAPGNLVPRDPLVATVTAEDVAATLSSGDLLVVDARSPDRFRGENETLDPVGGHIPGARNRFFRENLEADGRFKSPARLREEWKALLDRPARRSIMQCGSGVTACHNLLALEIAGLEGAALYPGSWSEWCSDPRRPVER